MQSFNQLNQREFFSNGDYERVGGVKEELDSDFKLSEWDADSNFSDIDEEIPKQKGKAKKIRIFKRKGLECSSRIGGFKDQKLPLPNNT